jgi:hypothetical protein
MGVQSHRIGQQNKPAARCDRLVVGCLDATRARDGDAPLLVQLTL